MSETEVAHEEKSPHHHWPHRWWHYPFMPVVILIRMRPSASARAWFLWGIITSILHAIVIVAFFELADIMPQRLLDWCVFMYPLYASFVTYIQVKSIGERPPGEEEWDKLDNRTSYMPIGAVSAVVLVHFVNACSFLSLHKSWWGIGQAFGNFLPDTWGQTYSCFIIAVLLAGADAALIDVQYLISRGLTRVKPSA